MERNEFILAANKGALSGAYLLHGEEDFIKGTPSLPLLPYRSGLRDLNMDVWEQASATML